MAFSHFFFKKLTILAMVMFSEPLVNLVILNDDWCCFIDMFLVHCVIFSSSR